MSRSPRSPDRGKGVGGVGRAGRCTRNQGAWGARAWCCVSGVAARTGREALCWRLCWQSLPTPPEAATAATPPPHTPLSCCRRHPHCCCRRHPHHGVCHQVGVDGSRHLLYLPGAVMVNREPLDLGPWADTGPYRVTRAVLAAAYALLQELVAAVG